MKPVLYVTRRLPEAIEARAARDYEARLSADDAVVTADEIVAGAAGAAAVLCCPAEKLTAEVIGRLPETVKVVGTFSVGYDHVDVAALRARGIALVNTPDVLSVATAECAMLLILAAARRAGEGERMVRAGPGTGGRRRSCWGRWFRGGGSGFSGWGGSGGSWRGWRGGSGWRCITGTSSGCRRCMEKGAVFHEEDDGFLAVCDVLSPACARGARGRGTG